MSEILYFTFTHPNIEEEWVMFEHHAIGVLVPGDPNLAPTRWWKRPLMRWFARMNVAVFAPGPAARLRGYRVGVMRHDGSARLSTRRIQHATFAILLYREAVTVFITDPSGNQEEKLYFVRRQSLASARADGIPVASA